MLEPFADAQVLVIDDNEASATLLQMLLSRARVRTVHVLTDPLQALERLDELGPDLVLLDLHMPRMDGYTLLTRLRERASAADLPVVVLTADTSREATRRALSLGANDFLTKPLDTTEVLLRVRNLLESQALHRNLQQRQRWLEASGQITRELLSGTRPEPLRLIAEHVRELSDADLAVTTVPDPDGPGRSLLIATREGIDEQHAVAVAERVCLTLASRVISEGRPLLVDGSGPDESSRTSRAAAGEVDVGHVMVLPLVGAHSVRGALALCRRRGRPRFTDVELETATSFANQAAMALELADARADQERVLVLEDRHRIARDLHDHVIQQVFAAGLVVQATASRLQDPAGVRTLQEVVGNLDDAIRQIRVSIFQLQPPAPGGLRAAVMEVVADVRPGLGLDPRVDLDGPLDSVATADLLRDVTAVVREGLINVARHASASAVALSLYATSGRLTVTISDDGDGMGDVGRRSGLDNMRERAESRNGSMVIAEVPDLGGTTLVWTVPIA
jgi:signal transduction histidine kinase